MLSGSGHPMTSTMLSYHSFVPQHVTLSSYTSESDMSRQLYSGQPVVMLRNHATLVPIITYRLAHEYSTGGIDRTHLDPALGMEHATSAVSQVSNGRVPKSMSVDLPMTCLQIPAINGRDVIQMHRSQLYRYHHTLKANHHRRTQHQR